ncbi:MAG: hypothetical protein HY821_06075 [Acidobacteria bacterium]|nr:hypothetical protein [Acidobacteriota bacterium]
MIILHCFFALFPLAVAPPASAAVINLAASANGGVASRSSTYLGDTATLGPQWANDGDTNGNYTGLGHIQPTGNETNPSLLVSFNGAYGITELNAFNRTDTCADLATPLRSELLLSNAPVFP